MLLLHGLMGRATTWAGTAEWLTPRFHVVGLDQRGHGLSDKPEAAADYDLDLFVEDAVAAIEQLGLAPAVIIGHSMAAQVAWVLAARRPELVRGLVLEDKQPSGSQDQGAFFDAWFKTWPVPFPTMSAMMAYFGRQRRELAEYFLECMVEREDGYHPIFEFRHMLQTLRGANGYDTWAPLEAVRCPALVVKGGDSDSPREVLQEMARKMKKGTFVEVPGATHVVHYSQPEAWRAAVEAFVVGLG
jgi:pimeloyl-ACP methyl ester carboxylesterase